MRFFSVVDNERMWMKEYQEQHCMIPCFFAEINSRRLAFPDRPSPCLEFSLHTNL